MDMKKDLIGETQERQLQELQTAIAQRGSATINFGNPDHSCLINGDGPHHPGCPLGGFWRFLPNTSKDVIQDERTYRHPMLTGDDE